MQAGVGGKGNLRLLVPNADFAQFAAATTYKNFAWNCACNSQSAASVKQIYF